MSMKGKDLLALHDLAPAEVEEIFRLTAELKQRAVAHGGKRAKLVTTGCLGICPKRAVVTASAATTPMSSWSPARPPSRRR